MLQTSDAIVLDVFDLHESDRIVTLLTPSHGKVRAVANGARRKYSRFAGNLQPLAKVRATWFQKEGRDLGRISGVDLLRPAAPLQRDLEGILLGGYLLGHAIEFGRESEADPPLFRLLDTTIEALLSGVDRDLASRYFETWVLRLAGVYPAPRECPETGRAFGEEGGVVPPSGEGIVHPEVCPVGGYAVGRSTLDFLVRIQGVGLAQLADDPPPEYVLRQAEEAATRVRRAFLQHELKSHRVMQEVLSSCARSKI